MSMSVFLHATRHELKAEAADLQPRLNEDVVRLGFECDQGEFLLFLTLERLRRLGEEILELALRLQASRDRAALEAAVVPDAVVVP